MDTFGYSVSQARGSIASLSLYLSTQELIQTASITTCRKASDSGITSVPIRIERSPRSQEASPGVCSTKSPYCDMAALSIVCAAGETAAQALGAPVAASLITEIIKACEEVGKQKASL
jgi:hypothetical protein